MRLVVGLEVLIWVVLGLEEFVGDCYEFEKNRNLLGGTRLPALPFKTYNGFLHYNIFTFKLIGDLNEEKCAKISVIELTGLLLHN